MNPINLLLVVLPIALCLNLEIEDASNLHFCHIGDVAGTVGMAQVFMTLESHCRTLLGALIERESVWFNRFNRSATG
jgi:hypothetical protein